MKGGGSIILNYPVILSYQCSTTVSLETYPLYSFSFNHCHSDKSSFSSFHRITVLRGLKNSSARQIQTIFKALINLLSLFPVKPVESQLLFLFLGENPGKKFLGMVSKIMGQIFSQLFYFFFYFFFFRYM